MEGWSLLDLTPGAWFLALAIVLIATVRRFFDPLPQRIALLAVLLPLGTFAPSLVAGRIQLPLDFLAGFDPWRQMETPARATHPLQGDLPLLIQPAVQKVRWDLLDGRWPLWNDSAGAGMPLLGDPQAQSFQPLVLLAYALPVRAGPAVVAACKVFLAFLFTFLLLRRQGLVEAAAALGGLAFALSGFVLLWLGWPLGTTVVWLPVVLYGLLRTEQENRAADRVLLVASGVGLLLAGHPQGVAFACGLIAVFAGSRLRTVPSPIRPTAVRWLVLGGIALCLACPVLLPAWTAIEQSERQAVLERTHPSLPPLDTLASTLFSEPFTQRLAARLAPDSLGDHRWGSYWGPVNSLEDGGAFVSTTALLLALLAIGRRKRRPQELAVGWSTAVALAITLIPPSLIAPLPVVGFLLRLGPQRLLGIAAFGLSYLAACAVDRWLRGEEVRQTGWILCSLLGVAILWAFFAHPPPAGRDPLSAFRGLGLALQLATLVAAAVLLRLRNHRRRAAWILCALVGVELLIAHGPANPTAPKKLASLLGGSEKWVAPEKPAPLAWLREHAGSDRIVGLGLALPPNTAAIWGLADPRVNNPLEPAAYRQALRPLHSGAQAWEMGQADSPLWDLLNVRFFLAPRGQAQPAPLELRLRHPAGWIWERPTVLPRLFLPRAAEVFRGGSWHAWLAENPDFSEVALVQPRAGDAHSERWRSTGSDANLEFQEDDSTHWRAEFSAEEQRLMASSLYQDGGWKLLVDGHPHPPRLANGPFLAAWIPPGRHRLDLLYRPKLHRLGCLLAALGLTLFANAARPQPRARTKAEPPRR